ncbi:MAG TPA: metallopeptidase family protein [Solirubrobacteraceae bacterium]|jgi:predicted Zn-dependent protease with MMP-like domain|nr:metallopeptidase family protein [Solirubrobacteraceae bacterium]
MPRLRRIAFAAVVALAVGLTAVVAVQGFSTNGALRAVQTLTVVATLLAAIGGVFVAIGLRMADWRDPESEAEFDRIVERSERLARAGTAAEPGEGDFLELDPFRDEDFEELVREALDELPDLLQDALRRNVAVVISDHGRRMRAYGLYQGDGVTRDNVPDRIVIFRDTLRRDFGHDPDLLREQVTVTVRHELAHHLGADELGVRDLGL